MTENEQWLDSLQGSGIRPGLGRIRAILRNLGRPQKKYDSIIVAGTNGKGSTSAMLASILRASGYRTGLYTSPHLVDIRERWQIDGEWITEEAFDSAIGTLRKAAGATGIVPTYFEALTIIAFIAFADAACEVVVLEVGMGGRLDATNVIHPIAAVITPISFDHMEFLGTTIRRIAGEKAGVIHRGAIVLTSNDDPRVLRVIEKRAAKFGCELHVVNAEHDSPLAGDFQRHNAALAVRAAEELRRRLPRITEASIELGAQTTRWPGRLQKLRWNDKEIWIDGGHNVHAAQAIAPFIASTMCTPRTLVFGIMSDKEVDAVAQILFPMFDRVITTEAYPPRSATAARLAEIARALGTDAVAVADPRRAFDAALQSDHSCIVIAGSLYLAGAALEHFSAVSA